MSVTVNRAEIYRTEHPAMPSVGLRAGYTSIMRTDVFRSPIEIWQKDGPTLRLFVLTPDMIAAIKEHT